MSQAVLQARAGSPDPFRGTCKSIRRVFTAATATSTIEVNQQRLEQPLPKPRTDHSTQTRSLRSRSRIDWAVEAARRVRGELVVAGLQVDGLRGGAGAPTDAGGERPTC